MLQPASTGRPDAAARSVFGALAYVLGPAAVALAVRLADDSASEPLWGCAGLVTAGGVLAGVLWWAARPSPRAGSVLVHAWTALTVAAFASWLATTYVLLTPATGGALPTLLFVLLTVSRALLGALLRQRELQAARRLVPRQRRRL